MNLHLKISRVAVAKIIFLSQTHPRSMLFSIEKERWMLYTYFLLGYLGVSVEGVNDLI